MSQVKNLQKENLKLKGEISAVNSELQKLKSIIEQQRLQADIEQVGDAATRYGNNIQKSVDFLCEDHHITKNFRENISKELDNLSRKPEAISTRVDSLDAAIDDLLKYSFQYNVKIIGFPEQDEHESAETTTQLCLKLFHAIRAEGVTKNDIEIAHRVNSRRSDSHYPRPIVCKFIRRLAKEELMAHRNETSNLNPDDLDLSADFHTENIRIHEHLILRLQQLLSEANKHQFQYVWVKNSEIWARKSSSSQVFKLKRMVDLDNLRQSLVSHPTQDQGDKCLKCYSFIILMM